MATQNTGETIVPCYEIQDGQLENLEKGREAFVENADNEAKRPHYAFCFDGDEAHCREEYTEAETIPSELDKAGLDPVILRSKTVFFDRNPRRG